MLGNHFTLTIRYDGTLAANKTFSWTAPFQCHVESITEKASNNSDATGILGISSDTDSILTSHTIGDSEVPTTKTVSDFATTNPTGRINAGDVLTHVLDFDGSAGTAAQNVDIVIMLTEG